MINILLANKINKNIDTIESIKDLIEPIDNHPLINFKHFDTDAKLYSSDEEFLSLLELNLQNKNIFFLIQTVLN